MNKHISVPATSYPIRPTDRHVAWMQREQRTSQTYHLSNAFIRAVDNLFLISFGYVSLAFSSSLYNPIALNSSQIGFGLRTTFFFAITSLNANNNFHIRAHGLCTADSYHAVDLGWLLFIRFAFTHLFLLIGLFAHSYTHTYTHPFDTG